MRVLIIGASQGIGLATTRQALAAGHKVRAFARSADAIPLEDPKLEKMRGDALNSQDVATALNGVDVVIQTLGIRIGSMFRPVLLFSEATRILVDAMASQHVRRLISVTGFGAGEQLVLGFRRHQSRRVVEAQRKLVGRLVEEARGLGTHDAVEVMPCRVRR